jgi:glycosyltransferase A (GT-A) superfamily protein (DUF2064 family)
MSPHFTKALVVFARAPQPGRVKSRLAREIGDTAATECYAAFLRDTLILATRVERDFAACSAFVAHTPEDAFEAGPYSLAPFWNSARLPQNGANLGERMSHCIQNLHFQGAQEVVLIGSDSPDLKFEFIVQAFEFLQAPVA